jgi:hypothetical protein
VYTVQPGDYLSKIAQAKCGNPADWTGIWVANKAKVPDPNIVFPKQQLVLDCRTAPVSAPAPVKVTQSPAQGVTVTAVPEQVSMAGMSAFQSCVIRAESGGNSQIWNPSGHWGLYQFSEQTWVGHGGAAADFGKAGAAEQTRVFWQTVHDDGTSDWAPYDGC